MKFVLSGANVFLDSAFRKGNVLISDGTVIQFSPFSFGSGIPVFDFNNNYIFPGFTDVHVHLREPGFSYKETIETGTKAAAAGGYTAVCAMPNVNPVPSTLDALNVQRKKIKENAEIEVFPYGSITKDEKGEILSDMEELAPFVCAFSDDGKGVQSEKMMEEAMKKAKSLNKIIAAHCEDESLLHGGYIHDGAYAKAHGHKGICSESEYLPIARDIELCRKTGCKYHVCHISAAESVDLIRKAKAEGVDITCETAPHYLVLNDSMLKEDGRFKMNPPVRSEKDRLALIEGLKDGTIDMIATDHAPHSAEEKSRGLDKSLMGVVGLETAFPILYTHLVKTNIITLEKLISLLHEKPNNRFNIDTAFEIGKKANLTVFDLNEQYTINPNAFQSKGRSTPFAGDKVFGKCKMTIADGRIVWTDSSIKKLF